jgi:hypothetical protein
MIPIFVGYDHREAIAYSTFCHSVLARTKSHVSFTPVTGEQRDGSNAFIYERFNVPKFCSYKGWAIWADGDMLCRADIAELWEMRDSFYDVMVVKHDYRTKFPVKYLGQRNEDYPRKNWSSLMLINCANYPWRIDVASMSGSQLHRFEFLRDHRIGSLPAELAHFTIGAPCWEEYGHCDYAGEWLAECTRMTGYERAPHVL